MASPEHLIDTPIQDLVRMIAEGQVSACDVATAFMERASRLDPVLRAFIHLQADHVMAQASRVDAKRAAGQPLGRLAGVPVAIKDSICTVDAPTTCGSKILMGREGPWQPPYDATVVSKLRAQDAIIFGKTNLDEFAMGSSTENSAMFATRNPWDIHRVPGGSSGGSAVAVAARMSPAALGSDTGGSIRQPAALTHTVGLKPTYGRVSRFGLVAFASSLDQIGPLACDVRGTARMLAVLAGHDPQDSTSAAVEVSDYEASCEQPVTGLRIGVPEEYFGEGLDPQVARSVTAALDALRKAGCQTVPIRLAHTHYGVAAYYVIATAEASSNLARFDGVRFGSRVSPAQGGLAAMYSSTRGSGFGREVKRRIMLGTYVLSAGYYDAYYRKAQRVRTLIRRDFDEAFEAVDVIAAPTSPTVAWRLGAKLEDPLAMYLADIYTLPASLAGLPAISIPCEPVKPSDAASPLPTGLQLIAPAFQETTLFRVAASWEAMNPHRASQPPELCP